MSEQTEQWQRWAPISSFTLDTLLTLHLQRAIQENVSGLLIDGKQILAVSVFLFLESEATEGHVDWGVVWIVIHGELMDRHSP